MAEFTIDEKKFFDIIDSAMMVGFNILENEVKNAVPRDKKRLPNLIMLKTKPKPERNIKKGNKYYYRLPVQIAGSWYEGVTGNLARSIATARIGFGEYHVGVLAGITEKYAKAQEFGYPDGNIPKRSFLLDPLEKNQKKIMLQIEKTFLELLNK